MPDFGTDTQIYTLCVGSAPTILAIDHSSTDLIALRSAFSNVGVANPLVSVRSDQEAKCYLNGEPPYSDRMNYPLPSVILLDMGDTGGFELLTWIRDRFPGGGLLIIALTPLEEIRHISRAYALGANSFLTKPVNASELQEVINIFTGYWLVQRWPGLPQPEFAGSLTHAYDS